MLFGKKAAHMSSREEGQNFFKSQTVSRLKELTQIADKWAAPRYIKVGCRDGRFPDLSEGWYRTSLGAGHLAGHIRLAFSPMLKLRVACGL